MKLSKKKTFNRMLTFFLCLSIGTSLTYASPYSQSELYLDKNGPYIKSLADHKIISDSKDGMYHPDAAATRQDVIDMLYLMTKNLNNFSQYKLRKKLNDDSNKINILNTIYTSNQKDNNQPKKENEKDILENKESTQKDSLKNTNETKAENKKDEKKSELKKEKNQDNKTKAQAKDKKIEKKDINKCFINLGLIPAADISTFDASKNITKEEFASYIYAFLNTYNALDKNKKIDAKDIQDSNYKTNIKVLLGNKIFYNDENGNFNPKEILSKGDLAKFISYISNFKIEKLPPIKIHYTVLNVPYVSQLYPVYAPIGCEPTSVYAALRYKGYAQNTTHRQFLNQMPYDSIDPRRGFVGSPYAGFQNYSKRETIFPNALANYAKKYGNAVDISGATVEDIQKELMLGNPVVAYLTFDWESPRYRTYYVEGNNYTWLRNNHVVVVCGYDPATNRYYVSDPWNKKIGYGVYKYWVNGSTFKSIYDARRHAIAVR